MRIAEAHCDNEKGFVVRADEKLTAFLERQSANSRPALSSYLRK
jgi:hypothetical protein